MHCKITPRVGQNETCAGECDGHGIIFITSETWAVAGKEINVKSDKLCQVIHVQLRRRASFCGSGHVGFNECRIGALELLAIALCH